MTIAILLLSIPTAHENELADELCGTYPPKEFWA